MKKIILIVLLLIVLTAVSAGIWAYFAFLYTKPLSKGELAELTPDWSVVTHGNWSPWFTKDDGTKEWNPAASFNAWLATVPEDEKAWAMLIELFYPYPDGVMSNDYLGSIPYDAPQWEQLVDVISSAQSDEILSQLKIALSRPVMGVPMMSSTDPYEHDAMIRSGLKDDNWDPAPVANQNMMLVALPSLGRHRSTANFLNSRAAYELENGNVAEFIAIMDLSIRSSKLSLEVPILIGHLVRGAIVAKGFDTIDWALTTHPESFNAAQLMQLDQLIAAHTLLTWDWQGEALMFHDSMRRFAGSDGKIGFRSMGAWANTGGFDTNGAEPCSLPELKLHASLQRPLAIYNIALERTSELGAIPWDQSAKTGSQIITDELSSFHVSVRFVMDILTPFLDNIPRNNRMLAQHAIALQTAIAIHRYRLQTGHFPESLDKLGSKLLKIDPLDAFTGESLRYILTDDGPMIYSVADDRDDDLGAPMHEYDIDALFEASAPPKKMMVNRLNKSKKSVIGIRKYPLWVTPERAKEIDQVEPKAVDGDWILYPTQRDEPKPIEEDDDDWDLEPALHED